MKTFKALLPVMVICIALGIYEPAMAQSATPIECGSIVEDEFTQDNQPKLYSLQLSAGDSLQTSVVPLGSTLFTATALYGPNNSIIWAGGDHSGSSFYVVTNPQMETGVLSANGTYTIVVYNNSIIENRDLGEGYSTLSSGRGGVGVYTLYVGCTLRDGTQIPAGSNAPVPEPGNNDQGVVPEPPTPVEPPAFGFPGVTPRDFSEGIELPITRSSPQTPPLASDVALYTYQASANETANLRIVRVSGDISIGVAVINRDTNEIIFLGGLPSSNNLSVELTFPSDGIYVFGLFRLDTVERSGTSGAVQISIE